MPGDEDISRGIGELLQRIQVYPGFDSSGLAALEELRPLLPSLPFVLYGGDYLVGTADRQAPPGTYRTMGSVDGCYWETLDAAGEINDNNFVNAAPQVIMTIRAGDFAINSEDCAPWVKIG